jgi:uncharacterized protein (DUF4415 family)
MPHCETAREATRARAHQLLSTPQEEKDAAITEAALADPDAQPLDALQLVRHSPIAATKADELTRRLRGRPLLPAPKHLVSLHLDPEVVAHFRANGPGWQSRINEALRAHLP